LKVSLDGTLVDEEAARVSASDRGFLVGDGVFETLRVYDGRPFALDEHLARLEASAAAMRMPLPGIDLARAASDVLLANELSDARMRITITSGPGPPGLARGGGPPTVLVVALPIAPWPSTSTAIVSRLRRDEHRPLAGVKTTSLAESVIALAEASDAGADEALLLNTAGNLCEATTANVFLVREGIAATPPLDSGCLAGITRAHVLQLGAEERTMSPDDLLQADEAFLTSSTREVQPLVAIDGRPVGSGRPGDVTRRLADAYSEWVAARLG
jgi:branched-subunit amino acid aminotransferase/4-amino-4-deoxychorismate lyase